MGQDSSSTDRSSTLAFVSALGEFIRRRRSELGVSQPQLAAAAGVHPRQIRRYESGEQQPVLAVAVRMASALGVTLDELAGVGLPDLTGGWWAAWQLGGDAVATLPVELTQRGSLIRLETAERRGHVWRGELRLWDGELLIGWDDPAEGAVRWTGAMLFALRDGRADGRWIGRSGTGAIASGRAALAHARDDARASVDRLSDGS